MTGLFSAAPEAIIEIEETFLRFLVPVGSGWKSALVPIRNGDTFGALKQAIPEQIGSLMRASVVLWNDAGSRILPFPVMMGEPEILEHLSLKKEDYFGSNAEMIFALRPLGLIDQKNREYLVSSVNRLFFNRLLNAFTEVGCGLNRVATALEAVIGRFCDQRDRGEHDGSACIISLGYSQVNMIVLRDGDVKAIRTSLTGSVKELEKRLAEALKLKADRVEELLSGAGEAPDASTTELMLQNMRELLARITPFFAFIRSKEKESSKQTIFLSLPCLEIKGLKELLEQSFSLPVKMLDTASAASGGGRAEWLAGALHRQAVSLLPPRPPLLNFTITPRLAWLFVIFFLCVPWAIIKMNHTMVRSQIEAMRGREVESRRFLQQTESLKSQNHLLQEIVQLARAEIPHTVAVSGVLAEIAGRIPPHLRLNKLEYAPDNGLLSIHGTAIDTESGLGFWEHLKRLPWLRDPKIAFSQGTTEFSKGFTITGEVKQLP
jgi:hypothetical protein